MAQITIYLDDDTERLVRRHVRSSRVSTSKWVAEAIRRRAVSEWPADVLALFGSWKDEDFPDAAALRKVSGSDVRREKL
jgi:hypothetical protein